MQGSMLIKVESSIIQTVFWGQQMLLYAIVVQEDLENLLLQICLQRITAKDAIQKKCFPGWKSVRQKISELKEYYPDVLPEENHSLAETLARINTVTGRKFIVIIDEWDVLIRDEATKEDIQNEYIRFLRGIFKGTEPTKYVQLAYLTGILPINLAGTYLK